MPVVAAEGVRKQFGDLVVLDGVDLTVDAHEVVALIGPSGSGKSTLLRCMNGLERVDGGRVLIGGVDLGAPATNLDRARQGIGFVFQSFNLFPHLSVLDNITLGPRKAKQITKAEAVAKADALLERFGLIDKRSEFPDRLSGGQQQRAAIIRALAMEPDVLLLDEVTSALDPELVADVLALLRELAAAGMTMVLATHEMGFARDTAHRVCLLDRGRIVEQGPPTQLFASPQHPRTKQFLQRITDAGRL